MNLLHAGVNITVIALWLGHESPATTRIYLHADMALNHLGRGDANPDRDQHRRPPIRVGALPAAIAITTQVADDLLGDARAPYRRSSAVLKTAAKER